MDITVIENNETNRVHEQNQNEKKEKKIYIKNLHAPKQQQ